ncbi:MAG: hypothetical protein GX481_08720, partial [Atopobium sp.]|nr:hypothetical protein [Atopobium sp.]
MKMTHKKHGLKHTLNQILSTAVMAGMVCGLMPTAVLAEGETTPATITGFETIADATVENGTMPTLPEKVKATVDGVADSQDVAVTWSSDPAYQALEAGDYTYTAALPEDTAYVLGDGVAMPSFKVTVKEAAGGEAEPSESPVTVVLSEAAQAFVNAVTAADANKEAILTACREYVDAYKDELAAEGEEATAAADAVLQEKEDAYYALYDQQQLLDDYDALTDEDKAAQAVIDAKALLDALVKQNDKIQGIETDSDDPSTYAAGVTKGLAGSTATQIDLSTVTGDVYIKADGLYVGGTASRASSAIVYTYSGGSKVEDFNVNGYEFSGTSTNKTILVDPDTDLAAKLILNGVAMTQSSTKSAIVTTHSDTTIVLQG